MELPQTVQETQSVRIPSLTAHTAFIQCGHSGVGSKDAGTSPGWAGQGTEAPEGGARIAGILATKEQGMITPRRGRGQGPA